MQRGIAHRNTSSLERRESPAAQTIHAVIVTDHPSEFLFGLSFHAQDNHHEDWLLQRSPALSVQLGLRTLYFSNLAQPDNPFTCIVFD